jgi:hypothetical protein
LEFVADHGKTFDLFIMELREEIENILPDPVSFGVEGGPDCMEESD